MRTPKKFLAAPKKIEANWETSLPPPYRINSKCAGCKVRVFKQTGSKSIWWVRELKRESGCWYPTCSVVVSLPLFLLRWETVTTSATFRPLFGWCPLWIESVSSPYAAGAQQAAAFQLNWRDLSDPKRSVATSDRTLPVLPSSPSLPLSLCPYSATHPAPPGHRAHWRVLSTLCWQAGRQQT